MRQGIKFVRILLGVASVAWLSTQCVAKQLVVNNDEFKLTSKMVQGFPKILITRSGVKASKIVYQAWKAGQFINYVIPWRIEDGNKVRNCFLVAYEYGSGASNHLTVIGPTRNGRWAELLSVDSVDAYRFQPEFVDLVGDGIVDILNIADLPRGKSQSSAKNALGGSKVQIWGWSPKADRYLLAATTPFSQRLTFKGSR